MLVLSINCKKKYSQPQLLQSEMSFYSKFRLDKAVFILGISGTPEQLTISAVLQIKFHSCKIFHSSPMTAFPDDILVIPLNTQSNDQLECPKA